jgi:uncharacterized membrane protein YoaK (UPF0700 family)
MTTNIAHFVLALGEVLAGGDEDAGASARKRVIHIFPVIVGFALGCALGAVGQAAWLAVSGSARGLALLAVVMSLRGDRKNVD